MNDARSAFALASADLAEDLALTAHREQDETWLLPTCAFCNAAAETMCPLCDVPLCLDDRITIHGADVCVDCAGFSK